MFSYWSFFKRFQIKLTKLMCFFLNFQVPNYFKRRMNENQCQLVISWQPFYIPELCVGTMFNKTILISIENVLKMLEQWRFISNYLVWQFEPNISQLRNITKETSSIWAFCKHIISNFQHRQNIFSFLQLRSKPIKNDSCSN